jgi:putative DNA primase/helicase
LLVGPTNTGKTTFAETLRKVLGDDYAKVTGFETFVYSRNRSTIRNDLARLKGARLVTASEARPDDKFDEQLVKLTTGQDTYIARYLYQEFQEIRPEFKIILTANHKPKIEGVDDAIWNRFHVIPFKVSIPQREQDRELGGKLMKEAAGILAWAVRGCHEWQKLGALNPPARVVRALKVYQQESDPIFGFLRDRCYTYLRATETSARLYTEYTDWCSKNQEEPIKAKKFGSLLSQKDGIESVRNLTSDEGKQARGYRGIVLKSTMAKNLLEEIKHSYETRNSNAK